MPAVRGNTIEKALASAVEQSGWTAALTSASRRNPKRFVVWDENDRRFSFWAYIWTLTPGGRPQLRTEYRIQITGVESPLELNPAGRTVILGYEPNLGMFAGFDLSRHKTFTAGSPSVQVDIECIREAVTSGIAFNRKANDEIAVGIRPDLLVNYIENAEELHGSGSMPEIYEGIERAAKTASEEEAARELGETFRRRVVSTVSRVARLGNFRKEVLAAYEKRCAVTGLQLDVVQAAHILPVVAPKSVDSVRNGIALSPTYHIAYDKGLIYLDREHRMRLNEQRVAELRTVNLVGGLDDFEAPLGRIILPVDDMQWPEQAFIDEANRFREIPV